MSGRFSAADAIKTSIQDRLSLPSSTKLANPQTPSSACVSVNLSGNEDGDSIDGGGGALRAGGGSTPTLPRILRTARPVRRRGSHHGDAAEHRNAVPELLLNMEGQAATAARALLGIPWSVKWFWLGLPIVEAVPAGMGFAISSFVVVELADIGNETMIYGLMTAVGNLSGPFSSTLTKTINAKFDVYNDDILNDTHEVRKDVTIAILISYVSKLFSLAFLAWLPHQKEETLKRNGSSSSRRLGGITIAYCLFALAWSIMANLFSDFESTRWFKITGGCEH